MDEKSLLRNGFEIFARENTGYASIVVKKESGSEGRMIIDTAASKLFLEFTNC